MWYHVQVSVSMVDGEQRLQDFEDRVDLVEEKAVARILLGFF